MTSTHQKGRVVQASRKFVTLTLENEETAHGKLSSKSIDTCVGDFVLFEQTGNDFLVSEILPRTNCLTRSYGRTTKLLAANLDKLFIVTAPLPLFNTVFIDRILVSASLEEIPCEIIFNKHDLETERLETESLLSIYQRLGVPITLTSCVTGLGIQAFHSRLQADSLSHVAFAGVSGVGKTSLLNALLPEQNLATQSVGTRTGQGRQTTSLAISYPYPRTSTKTLYLTDLPGLQNFGVTHIPESQLPLAFPEFVQHSSECRFNNCLHLDEPNCGIRTQIEDGVISESRYENYKDMLVEIRRFKPY